MIKITEHALVISYTIISKTYNKYPKLSELHKHLFNTMPNGLHDAMADVLICLRAYVMMEHNQDICHVGCARIKSIFKLYCE